MENNFNPNGVGIINGNIFGLPYSEKEADIVIIPVPWDVTASYGKGTSNGPQAILDASPQIDYFDLNVHEPWKLKVALAPISTDWLNLNNELNINANQYIQFIESGGNISFSEKHQNIQKEINEASEILNKRLKNKINEVWAQGKTPVILGGEHSVPFSNIALCIEKYPEIGILQFDAHADLRKAYEGFEYSHASIFYNVLNKTPIKKIVQVGVRDLCSEETNTIEHSERITTFYSEHISTSLYKGETFDSIATQIVNELPNEVYVSFDIDGLLPYYCPNTGTPVPGGLEFEQAVYIINKVVESGRKIISFDLCEVAPGKDDWDANVGARILWKLLLALGKSNNMI